MYTVVKAIVMSSTTQNTTKTGTKRKKLFSLDFNFLIGDNLLQNYFIPSSSNMLILFTTLARN